jgi:hypothetical protein
MTGYPGSDNKGFNTREECVEAWQALCPLGVHPHPVDPAAQPARIQRVTGMGNSTLTPVTPKRERTPTQKHDVQEAATP